MRYLILMFVVCLAAPIKAQHFTKEFQQFLIDHSCEEPRKEVKYHDDEAKVTLTYFMGTPTGEETETTVLIDSLTSLLVEEYLDKAYGIGSSTSNSKSKSSPTVDDSHITIAYTGDWCDTRIAKSEHTIEYYNKSSHNKLRYRFLVYFVWWE